MPTTSVLWFRRDLRLGDNPALLAARDAADEVLPVFVLDDTLRRPSGGPRLAFLYRSLRALDDTLGGRLVVLRGKPENAIPAAVREVGATSVHIAADFGPYGRERDERVAAELARRDVELVRTGSPYAVAPGRVTKDDGTPFRVYTPFYRAWRAHGWRDPAHSARARVHWASGVDSSGVPKDPDLPAELRLPDAGERAALRRWADFRDGALARYGTDRNRPDLAGTSRLSVYLKYGALHPRTLLGDLGGRTGDGPETYRKELAWREFYADVLWHNPSSARECLNSQFAALKLDEGKLADERFAAWAEGRTGYPIVDAGMRQLRAEGWVHNRLRMIVASFLIKDLHVDWVRGAREFLDHLVDGDLASNNHGWQWVAGCGTDAAPYYRVFNPITQGLKFDPDGSYVRRYVPELRDVEGAAVHEPWDLPDGLPRGYPERIVDHAAERQEALDRYQAIRR